MIDLHHGDCLEVMRGMADNSVDAIVTDPPYGLAFMGKKWDYNVPSVEIWVEALRVLKPGGHLLSFGGSRTYHRLTCAIEDAGFEIRDQIMWIYGSGFPKSHDVSKGIDKAAGAEREVVGPNPNSRPNMVRVEAAVLSPRVDAPITAPATDAARQWQGWGTALKPAHEPICVARKPLASLDINVLRHVEFQLRQRGVVGGISWKCASASGAAVKNSRTSLSSIAAPQAVEIFVENAASNVTASVVQPIPTISASLTPNGALEIVSTSEVTLGDVTRICGMKSSSLMAENVNAAESAKSAFSPSITLTEEEPRTVSKCTERYTTNSAAKDFRADTECFAGIATGLTGSMAHVLIRRSEDGIFEWPDGLPEFVSGKPLTVAANVLEYGTGAINIDGCKVGTEGGTRKATPVKESRTINAYGNGLNGGGVTAIDAGRWPANVIHDGSDGVLSAFSGGQKGLQKGAESAARFFYCAKASKKDRDEGLTGDEQPIVTFATANGTSGKASSISEGRNTSRKNTHPTVKPTDLMRYLCRLVTPPGGVVLDPFMGSGSTGKAAKLEGFDFIGIEMDADYVEIARARIG